MFTLVTEFVKSTKVTKSLKVKRYVSRDFETIEAARTHYQSILRHARKDPHVAIVNITLMADNQVYWSLR